MKKKEITIKSIVKKYCKDNKFDGLYNDECECTLNDLMPCGTPEEHCQLGYVVNCKKDCNRSDNFPCITGKKNTTACVYKL